MRVYNIFIYYNLKINYIYHILLKIHFLSPSKMINKKNKLNLIINNINSKYISINKIKEFMSYYKKHNLIHSISLILLIQS